MAGDILTDPGDAVVNVCFHGIGTPGRELEDGEAPYWIGSDQFLRVLDEIVTWAHVQISFDDGNASDLRLGLPALRERGRTATFFALAGRLDTPGSLGSDDLRELRSQGMTVGTHGMAHRSWRGLSAAERDAELVTARQRLAEAVGTEVTEAACPLGQYDRRLLTDLRRLGYTRVYTSDRGAARDGTWMQPRFSVRSGDTPESLRSSVLASLAAPRRIRNGAVRLVKRWR